MTVRDLTKDVKTAMHVHFEPIAADGKEIREHMGAHYAMSKQSDTTRYYALVDKPDIHPPTRHYHGLPPELGDDVAAPVPLDWPRVVVIEVLPDGTFLDRFTPDGSSCGDTWHMSIEDAREQASAEYGGMLSEWRLAPSELSLDEVIARALGDSTS